MNTDEGYKHIVVITGGSWRHQYFKSCLHNSTRLDVVRAYCEHPSGDSIPSYDTIESLEDLHNIERQNFEREAFAPYLEAAKLCPPSRYVARSEINDDKIVDEIIQLNPIFLVTYGCGLIKNKRLLKRFKDHIINVHLGLSPYYFGSATNLQAMAEGNLSCVGYTFMYLDEGIDTGKIIHQRRAVVRIMDNCHTLGNRLIYQMAKDMAKLIDQYNKIKPQAPATDYVGKTWRRKDVTDKTLAHVYHAFGAGMCEDHLKHQEERDSHFPIVEQDFLK